MLAGFKLDGSPEYLLTDFDCNVSLVPAAICEQIRLRKLFIHCATKTKLYEEVVPDGGVPVTADLERRDGGM